MDAPIYDPAFNGPDTLSMTPAAQAHVRRQLVRQGAGALLVEITQSGCNGYMYDLKFVAEQPGDTHAFAFDDLRVFVAKTHWPLVRGTEIDYVTSGLNSALTFKNPNASGECGCGESFSVGAALSPP